MKMIAVTSSNVLAVGYDPLAHLLAVEFKNGGIYHYEGVSPDFYDEMQAADSIGSFVARRVRGNFKATKLEDKKDGE